MNGCRNTEGLRVVADLSQLTGLSARMLLWEPPFIARELPDMGILTCLSGAAPLSCISTGEINLPSKLQNFKSKGFLAYTAQMNLTQL